MNFFDIINYPLAYILGILYYLVNSYGLAIILFTIVIKAAMLPLGIKQQKSMLMQVKYQPKLQKIQETYKNDKVKLNEEIQKLYKEEGYNPLGGCLPLLIQLPILFGLYNVITHPLTYISGLTNNRVLAISQALGFGNDINKANLQIDLANAINDPSKLEIVKQFLPTPFYKINFDFLGVKDFLSGIPNWQKPSLLWIIPILACATGFAMSFITQRYTVQNEQTAGMSKSLMYMSPIMSLVFTFTFPAGVGLYWIMSNILGAVQAYVLGEKYNPKKYAAELKQQEQDERFALREAKREKKQKQKEKYE